MLVAIVLLLFAGVFIFDFMPVIKDGKKKQIWVYGIFYTISLLLIILYVMDIKILSPTQVIVNILKPIAG